MTSVSSSRDYFFRAHAKEFSGVFPNILSFLSPREHINIAEAFTRNRRERQDGVPELVTQVALIQARVSEVEANGKVSWKDLQFYRSGTGRNLSSEKVFELDVSNSNITDAQLEDLLELFPNAQKYNFSQCRNIRTETVVEFLKNRKAKSLKSLYELNEGQVNSAQHKIIQQMLRDKETLLKFCSDSLELKRMAEEGKYQGIFDKLEKDQDGFRNAVEQAKKSKSALDDQINQWANGNDPTLRMLARNYRGLESINFYHCEQITDANFQAIAENCPHLRTLDLSYCSIADAGIQAIAKNCPHLHTLNLLWCHNITNAGLQELAQNCRNLHTLDIRKFETTDAVLLSLAQNCENLNTLSVVCLMITDAALQELTQKCKNLCALTLFACSGITETGLKAITENCPNLHTLALSDCCITDTRLRKLTQKCKNLHILEFAQCDQITDEGLKAIAQNCPNLHTLTLSQCDQITDEGLKAIAQNCPNLHTLILSQSNQITDKGLKAIAQNCPHFHTLNLWSCNQITDEGLKAITENCPHFHTLNLWSCNQITDKGLKAIAQNCPHFHTLNLEQCNRISSTGLEAIAQNCPYLYTLKLRWCDQITRADVERLWALLPKLKGRFILSNGHYVPRPMQASAARQTPLRSISKAKQFAAHFGITAIHIASTVALGWIASYALGVNMATLATASYLGHRYINLSHSG